MSVFSKFIETLAKQGAKLTGKKAGRAAGEAVEKAADIPPTAVAPEPKPGVSVPETPGAPKKAPEAAPAAPAAGQKPTVDIEDVPEPPTKPVRGEQEPTAPVQSPEEGIASSLGLKPAEAEKFVEKLEGFATKSADELSAGRGRSVFQSDDAPEGFVDNLAETYGITPAFELKALQRDFNLSKFDDSADPVLAMMDAVGKEFAPEIRAASRGKRTNAQTLAKAQTLNLSVADLLKLETANAEQLNAGYITLLNTFVKLKAVTQTPVEELTPRLVLQQKLLTKEAVAVYAKVKGLQTEAARALQSARIMRVALQKGGADLMDTIRDFGATGGHARINQMLQQITDPAKFGQALRKLDRASTLDMVVETWYNAILSSPPTWSSNVTGSSLALHAVELPVHVTAAGIGLMRVQLGIGSPSRVYFKEALQYRFTFEAIWEGAKLGYTAFKTGESIYSGSKFPSRRQPKFTAANIKGNLDDRIARKIELGKTAGIRQAFSEFLEPGTLLQKGVDFTGEWVQRLPGRFIMSGDEWSKTVFQGASLRASAYAQALDEGITDAAALDARFAELMDDPDGLMPGAREEAEAFARMLTFQDRPPGQALLGFLEHIQKTQSLASNPDNPISTRMAGLLATMTVPFAPTMIGMARYGFKNLPGVSVINLIGVKQGTREGDIAMARFVFATGVFGGLLGWAGKDFITGGGSDDFRQRQSLEATGWQEYSIRIPASIANTIQAVGATFGFSFFDREGVSRGKTGDVYISYKRQDPLSQIVGAVADYHDLMGWMTENEKGEYAQKMLVLMWRMVAERSFGITLNRMSDALSAFSGEDPNAGRKLQRFLNGQIGSVIPSGVAWFGQTFDPDLNLRRVSRSDIGVIESAEIDQPAADKVILGLLNGLAETLNAVRRRTPLGKDQLPALNFFGEEVRFAPGWIVNLIPVYTRRASFTGADLQAINVDPLRWGSMRIPQDLLFSEWGEFINIVGVEGEFARLGNPVGMHRRQVGNVEMTNNEYHNFVKFLNEYRVEGVGRRKSNQLSDPDFDNGRAIIDYVGKTMKESLEELMQTEAYFNASDNRDARLFTKDGLIKKVVNAYKRRVDKTRFDDEGGALGKFLTTTEAGMELNERLTAREQEQRDILESI